MYWYTMGYPIVTVLNFERGYYVLSYWYWYIVYHLKFRARVFYTISGHMLIFLGPKFGTMVQYSGH